MTCDMEALAPSIQAEENLPRPSSARAASLSRSLWAEPRAAASVAQLRAAVTKANDELERGPRRPSPSCSRR